MIKKYFATLFISLSMTITVFAAQETAGKYYEPYEVTVGHGDSTQSYLLMNSKTDENQWYCARSKPSLYEYRADKKAPLEPAFSFIRFQKIDPVKPDKLQEGAIIDCSFKIGADKDTVSALKSKLPAGVKKNMVRLNSLPLEGIDLIFYKPDGKPITLLASSSQVIENEGDLLVSFSCVVSGHDAAVFNALLEGSGIKYQLSYKYNLLSEKQKKSFNVSFDKQKGGLTGSEASKADAKLVNYLSAISKNPKIISELPKQKTAEPLNNSSSNLNDSSEPFDLTKTVRKKAVVHTNKTRQSVDGVIKAVDLVYRIKEEKVITKEGILSLSGYPKEIQKRKMFTEASYDGWQTGYLLAPKIRNINDIELKNIKFNIELRCGSHLFETKLITWTKAAGWRNKENEPADIITFPLEDIWSMSGKDPLAKAFYKIKFQFEFENDDKITSEHKESVVNGTIPVSTPLSSIELLEFDFSNLFWDSLEKDRNRLIKIELSVKDDNRNCQRVVMPIKRSDKTIKYPEVIRIPAKLDSFAQNRVRATIYFHTSENKRVAWNFNGMKLAEYFETPYFMFFDDDWHN